MMMVDQAWRKTVLITTTKNRSLIIYFLKSAFLEEKDFDGEEDGSLAKFDSHLTFFSRFLFVPSADLDRDQLSIAFSSSFRIQNIKPITFCCNSLIALFFFFICILTFFICICVCICVLCFVFSVLC